MPMKIAIRRAGLLAARAGLLAAVSTALVTAPAVADDAYVCDGGRLVYARPETLEKLKQTDPCIAGYFPATPKVGAGQPAAAAAMPADNINAGRDARAQDKTVTPPVKCAAHLKEASLPSPVSPLPTDFRKVRVINATSDQSAAYFHHVR